MSKKTNGKEYEAWSKEELIKEIVKIKSTTYGLVWHRDLPEEKIDILVNPDARTPNEMFPNEMAGKPFPVLKEVKSKAIESDKSKLVNLLIEGDNYHSLAVLNFTHHEAIDLIYIDPPYNTGNNDFIYNDKFVDKEDSFRHSKWLSFMEKRLKLAKNLLKNEGLIYISIDTNEVAQLKMLCDEIFGENNLISTITVKVKDPAGVGQQSFIFDIAEYVLCYTKDINFLKESSLDLPMDYEEFTEPYGSYQKILIDQGKAKLIKEIERKNVGKIKIFQCKDFKIESTKNLSFKEYVKNRNKIFADYNPSGGMIVAIKEDIPNNGLSYIEYTPIKGKNTGQKSKTFFLNGRILAWLDDVTLQEKGKLFKRTKMTNVWAMPNASLHLEGGVEFANGKKPLKLIEKIISTVNRDATILDFFAGSGTTGHAVQRLNNKDGGNRRFILGTNNEKEICTKICYSRMKNIDKEFGLNLKYYVCDFVEAEPTDKNKRKLVKESTDMLCILENAFELVQETEQFKIFKNTDKYMGVIFYEEAIDDYKKVIKKIDGHFNTYVFSINDDPHIKLFTDIKDKVTLCAIPEVVLKVYREIFK